MIYANGFPKNSAQYFMSIALNEAYKAYEKSETPIGAIIVKDNKIISFAHNEKELRQDPTGHAEILAIQKACKSTNSWRLTDCDIYVTLEPCSMCAGAILHARLRNLYIGAPDPKAGAVGSTINLLNMDEFNHKVNVYTGILEDECGKALKDFFRELRSKK